MVSVFSGLTVDYLNQHDTLVRMKNFRVTLLVTLLLLIVFVANNFLPVPGSTESYGNDDPKAVELANIKSMILRREPRFSGLQGVDLAIALRDYVYWNLPVRLPNGSSPSYYDFDNYVYTSLYDNQSGALCGGLALNYLMITKAFGMQSRYVGIYNRVIDAPTPVYSHAGVEVFLDNKWIIMDPTWNFSVTDLEGNFLGWSDVRDMRGDITSLIFTENGMETAATFSGSTAARTLDTYFSDISELTNIVNFLSYAGSGISSPLLTPQKWDGQIRYADESTFDARSGGDVYAMLAIQY